MLTHKIKIIPQDTVGTFAVEMDDTRLDSIEDILIDMHAGNLPRVWIGFVSEDVDVELPRASVEVKKKDASTR